MLEGVCKKKTLITGDKEMKRFKIRKAGLVLLAGVLLIGLCFLPGSDLLANSSFPRSSGNDINEVNLIGSEPQPPSPELLEKIAYEGMDEPAGEEMAPIGFLEPFPNPKNYLIVTSSSQPMKEVEITNLGGITLPHPLRMLFVWELDASYAPVGLKIPVRFYLQNTGSSTIFGQFELKPFDLEFGLEGQPGRNWKEMQVSETPLMQPLAIPPGAIITDRIEIQFDAPGSYWLIPVAVFQVKGEGDTFVPYSLKGEALQLKVVEVK
jgi:hypothetical protein